MDALKNIREFASFCGNITGNNHQKKRVKNIFCSSLKILQELAKPLSERRFLKKKKFYIWRMILAEDIQLQVNLKALKGCGLRRCFESCSVRTLEWFFLQCTTEHDFETLCSCHYFTKQEQNGVVKACVIVIFLFQSQWLYWSKEICESHTCSQLLRFLTGDNSADLEAACQHKLIQRPTFVTEQLSSVLVLPKSGLPIQRVASQLS